MPRLARGIFCAAAIVVSAATPGERIFAQQRASIRAGVVEVAASAIVPGSGQAMMGQRRGFVYLALEAAGIGFYIARTQDGIRKRDLYRDISRDFARAPFSPAGPRGSWDYYERMEKYVESGAFDLTPGGAIDPETDAATFNGSVWLLARQTYWRDPGSAPPPASEEYQAAVRFYQARAVTPEFRWSWTGAPEAFQKYRAAIASSNSAFRSAEQTASLVLANHFLSAVDAYVSVHMRVKRNADGSTWLTASIPGQPKVTNDF
ncbi:MAG: hypothetical protein ABI681_13675 [Gemmatimonadales bacterium]